MTRVPRWRIVGSGLIGTLVGLALVVVALPGQRLIGDEEAQIVLDGVLALVAVTMVGAAYYTLRAGGCVPGPTDRQTAAEPGSHAPADRSAAARHSHQNSSPSTTNPNSVGNSTSGSHSSAQ
jgi:hypothetical protein